MLSRLAGKPLRFPSIDEDTVYSLVEDNGRVVLQADSRMSASGLITGVHVDPSRSPYLHWSWTTGPGLLLRKLAGSEHGTTFPLRLFVIFEASGGLFSFFKRLRPGFRGDAILYVSDTPSQPEANRSSHVSDRIKVVPLERGDPPPAGAGRCGTSATTMSSCFGSARPRNVAAVAVMTDTDNSRTECVSHFGDIYFSDAN